MPKLSQFSFGSNRQIEAVEALENWLRENSKSLTLLRSHELASYGVNDLEVGWRFPILFADRERRFDLLVTSQFPWQPPRIALVDRPEYLSWPHVEQNGVLCLLSPNSSIDVSQPIEVVLYLIRQAAHLVNRLAVGEYREDFADEFLTYWQRRSTEGSPRIFSLLDSTTPSSIIRCWRGKQLYLIGSCHEVLVEWLVNAYPATQRTKIETEPALLAWLRTMPDPANYPSTNSSLRQLIARECNAALPLLESLITTNTEELTCILGLKTANGSAFSATLLTNSDGVSRGRRIKRSRVASGFRPKSLPQSILLNRYFDNTSLVRANVERADYRWVHGREQDSNLELLHNARIVILGCGSVGGFVARMLAEAGVGSFVLVDPEVLSWSNVGRHVLGGDSVGLSKASALARELKVRYPHAVRVTSHSAKWQDVIQQYAAEMDGPTVLVSTIGSWTAESHLNVWHLERARKFPVVYGWTEAHALAGHAVTITSSGGCLQCGLNQFGTPLLRVTDWSPGQAQRTEPACGAVFQPYGPIELNFITSLIAEAVLDCIVSEPQASTRRIWAARTTHLNSLGGSWTEEWSRVAGNRSKGGFVEELPWPTNSECVECRTSPKR